MRMQKEMKSSLLVIKGWKTVPFARNTAITSVIFRNVMATGLCFIFPESTWPLMYVEYELKSISQDMDPLFICRSQVSAYCTGTSNCFQYRNRVAAEELDFVNHAKLRRLETVFRTKPKAAANMFWRFYLQALLFRSQSHWTLPKQESKKDEAKHENS